MELSQAVAAVSMRAIGVGASADVPGGADGNVPRATKFSTDNGNDGTTGARAFDLKNFELD